CVVLVLRDRLADSRHARGVGAGEVVAVAQGHLRGGFELAAEVEQERAVGDFLDLDAGQRLEGVGDLLGMGDVAGVGADVGDDGVRGGIDDVEPGHDGAGGGGCGDEVRGGGLSDGDADAQGDRVYGTGGNHEQYPP